jgi:hypothetical protein
LLNEELAMFQPAGLLLLTGSDWARWTLEQLGASMKWSSGLVEGAGTLNSSVVVVAKHPQGKREDVLVDEVVAILRSEEPGIVAPHPS